jgi:hypothetical protein
MRVRLKTRAAAVQLAAAVERVGGTALVIGDTIELVHPSGGVSPHTNTELEFFVRAWATASERAAAERPAVEILG